MDVNDLFYGNALDASSRLNDLEQFRDFLDGFLKREEVYFQEAHVDLQIEFLPLFSATFPPILHSSLVVSSVMLIELELRGFAGALKEHLALPLAMSDIQGSLLQRFRKYATAIAGLDLQFPPDRWADVVGIFEIRNCLVHNYGSLDEFPKRGVVEDFVRRQKVPVVHQDILIVDDSTSAKILEITSAFFDTIYEAALRRFPGKYNWPPLGNRLT